MNESRRRYAVEQYNLALVRRGLPVDHPRPESPVDNSRALVPYDPAKDVSRAGIDDLQAEIRRLEEQGPSSVFSLFDVFDESPESQEEEDAFLAAYNLILQQHPEVFNEERSIMTIPGAAGEETRASGAGQHAAKRQRTIEEEPSSAEEVAGSSGSSGGGRSVSGGTGQGYVIPRPHLSATTSFATFKKVHKFLSYGIAGVTMNQNIGTVQRMFYGTTSLAEIPVHLPHLYLSPGEWSSLPGGSKAVSLKVCVTQRNVRVAFETAATSSGLATLNQNKNGVYAIGLNKLPWIIRCSYAYDATETMKPTSVKAPTPAPTTQQLYGQNAANTPSAEFPHSMMGHPLALQNYCAVAIRNEGITGVGPEKGWPDLQAHINQFDAADYVGSKIVEYSYQPKEGWLRYVANGFPYIGAGVAEAIIPTGTIYQGGSTLNTGSGSTATFGVGEPATSIDNASIYSSDIEKSQYVIHQTGGHSIPKLQPSLHVGVMAVPSLSTNAGVSAPNSWTDVQTYFDVETEMVVEYHRRTEFSGESVSVRMPEQWYPSFHLDTTTGTPQFQSNNITRMGLLSYTNAVYMP